MGYAQEKTCTMCLVTFIDIETHFYFYPDRNTWYSRCKKCHNSNTTAKTRIDREINTEKHKMRYRKNDLKRHYNLTIEEYQEKIEEQSYSCAICKISLDEMPVNFAVDHDHACCPNRKKSCGKCVRGLLCSMCNGLLGFAKDSPEILMNAIEYLNKYSDQTTEK